MRSLALLCVVLLGALALVSAVAVDTTMVTQDRSAVIDRRMSRHLADVHRAVAEAEASMAQWDADEHLQATEATENAVFLELEGEQETYGLDGDFAGDALFMETGSNTLTGHVTFSDIEAKLDSGAETRVSAEAEVDATTATDSEAGAVTIHEQSDDEFSNHAQDHDAIHTQQDEVNDVLKQYGMLLEEHSEADGEIDAELDADVDSETELDSEEETEEEHAAHSMMETAAGEPMVSITKCGKKIIWERNHEPQVPAKKE